MTVDEKKDSLVKYRLEQAKEAIDDAVFLFENHRGARSIVKNLLCNVLCSIGPSCY